MAAQAPSYISTRARVWWKKLPPLHKYVILAQLEIAREDNHQHLYPGLDRIAAMTGLNRRTVQRVLHGEQRLKKGTTKRDPGRKIALGLIDQHFEVLVAKENAGRRRPRTYRLQLDAIPNDNQLLEECIRRGWRIPTWLQNELTPAQLAGIQQPLPFSAWDQEVTKWTQQNPQLWLYAKRSLQQTADYCLQHKLDPQRNALTALQDLGVPAPIAHKLWAARKAQSDSQVERRSTLGRSAAPPSDT
jgi:hypothetical protein